MELLRQSLAVIFVLFLLVGVLLWVRRLDIATLLKSRAASAERRMQLVERLVLTPQHSLQLVRISDRMLILAVHASGIQLLRDVSDVETETAGR